MKMPLLSLDGAGGRAGWWSKCHFCTQSPSAPQGLLTVDLVIRRLLKSTLYPPDLNQHHFPPKFLCTGQWYTQQNTSWIFKSLCSSNVASPEFTCWMLSFWMKQYWEVRLVLGRAVESLRMYLLLLVSSLSFPTLGIDCDSGSHAASSLRRQ